MLKRYFNLPKRCKTHVLGLNRIPEKVLLNNEPQRCTKEDRNCLKIIAFLNKYMIMLFFFLVTKCRRGEWAVWEKVGM